MTFDLDFKVTTFFDIEYLRNDTRYSHITARLKEKLTIAQEEKYLTYGMVLFGDIDWPLNASRGFVSIS